MYHTQSGNSFPMMFSMGNDYRGFDDGELYSSYAASSSSSPSASVDCTLSLGTPSTRGTNDDGRHHEKKRSSCMSNFGWNILPSKNTPPPSKPHRGGSNANSSAAGDPLLARRCANCDTTSTPLWRNGPRGPKSLCNACGIRYKKEERRATAAAATSSGASANAGHYETQYMMNESWGPASQKAYACYSSGYSNEYQTVEDDAADYRDSEMGGGGPFMSWRFNVTDRPSFVHDFTR